MNGWELPPAVLSHAGGMAAACSCPNLADLPIRSFAHWLSERTSRNVCFRPIADIGGARHGAEMDKSSRLSVPWVRDELQLCLTQLADDDPRAAWQVERGKGRASGIDEVFHFFFDDHDFDEADLGRVFFDSSEVEAVKAVKDALDDVLRVVGDRGDDEFVQHPLWPNVSQASRAALVQLSA